MQRIVKSGWRGTVHVYTAAPWALFVRNSMPRKPYERPRRRVGKGVGPKFDKEQLYHLYIEKNMSASQIADMFDSTQRSVQTTLSYLGIKKGQQQTIVVLTKRENEYFSLEAAARGMDTNDLVHKLLDIIYKDNMVAAILDDEHQFA